MDFHSFIDKIFYANEMVKSLYVCSIMDIPFIFSKTINYGEYTLIDDRLVSNNKITNRKLRIYRNNDKKITIQILPKGKARLSINFTTTENSKSIIQEDLCNKIIMLMTLAIIDNAKLLNIDIDEQTIKHYITHELNSIQFTSLSGYIKSSDTLVCANGQSVIELRNSILKIQKNIK